MRSASEASTPAAPRARFPQERSYLSATQNATAPSDRSITINCMADAPGSNPPAKPVSVRQLELAVRWMDHLLGGGKRMPEEMRREFFELFWEEQLERSRDGRPLRIPTGADAEARFLLAETAAGRREYLPAV